MADFIRPSAEEYNTLKKQLHDLSKEKIKLLYDLNKRVKELNCLYGISRLVDTPEITLEEILQGIVNLIPPAWQYPDITCSRLIFESKEFKTDNFKNTKLKQLADIKVHREKAGSIEVCLLEKKFKDNEKSFSKEEDILLEALAERIGKIIEHKKVDEALRKSDEEWHRTFDSISDLVFIQDNDHVILKANKAFFDALKSKPEEIIGKKCYEILHKTNSPWPNCPFEKTREDHVAHTEEVDDKNIGIPLLVTTSPIFNDSGKLIGSVHTAKDITEIKQAEEKLIALSLIDELTGLNNRRGFSILAAKQIKNADRYKHDLTLIYIDLDNMKWINDNLGHKEGDRALVDISNIFKKSFRSSDIIARLGGDEFAGLVAGSHGTTSEMTLARLQESINELNSQKIRPYNLSISFGAIPYDNENPCSLDELLERGDKAMYEHKQKKGVYRGENIK